MYQEVAPARLSTPKSTRTRSTGKPQPPLYVEYKLIQLERLAQAIDLAKHRWGDFDPDYGTIPRPYYMEEVMGTDAPLKSSRDGKCFRITKWGNPDYEGSQDAEWVEGRHSLRDAKKLVETVIGGGQKIMTPVEMGGRKISKAWLGGSEPTEDNAPDEVEIFLKIGPSNWPIFPEKDATGEPTGNLIGNLPKYGPDVLAELKGLQSFIYNMTQDSEAGQMFLKAAMEAKSNALYPYEDKNGIPLLLDGYMYRIGKATGKKCLDVKGDKPLTEALSKWTVWATNIKDQQTIA